MNKDSIEQLLKDEGLEPNTEFAFDWTGTLVSKLDRTPSPYFTRTFDICRLVDDTCSFRIVSAVKYGNNYINARRLEINRIINDRNVDEYVTQGNIRIIHPPKLPLHFKPHAWTNRQFIIGDRPCREIQVGNKLENAITVLIRDPKMSICTEEPLTGDLPKGCEQRDGIIAYDGTPHFTFSTLSDFSKWLIVCRWAGVYEMLGKKLLEASDRDVIPMQLDMYHKMRGVGPIDDKYIAGFSCLAREPEKTEFFSGASGEMNKIITQAIKVLGR